MKIGTQYFRPPNPLAQNWEKDLDQIAQMGLDLVRLWLFWRDVEHQQDQWHFSAYDQLIHLAQQRGLSVVVQFIPECQPNWFLQKHQHLLPRDEKGLASLGLWGHSMAAVGGYPGIAFDHTAVVEATDRFVRRTLEHFRDQPAIMAWDVWNEIQPQGGIFSYDDVTLERFHQYLRRRYGTIESFNQKLCEHFDSFEQIPWPVNGPLTSIPSVAQVLLESFRRDRLVNEMQRRVAVIRQADPNRLVVAHSGAPMLIVNDEPELAKPLDAWGTSQHQSEIDMGIAEDYHAMDLQNKMTHAASGNKPWWLSELGAGQLYYYYGHTSAQPQYLRTSLLCAMAHEAQAAMLWQYRPERYGQESPGWGLVNYDGSKNNRTDAVSQIARTIQKESQRVGQAHRAASPVAVVFDPQQTLFEATAQNWRAQGISMSEEARGWMRFCQFNNIDCDGLWPQQIEAGQIETGCRVVYMPLNAIAQPAMYQKLLDWVHAGGVLLCSAYTSTWDQDHYMHPHIPGPPLGKALGLQVIDRQFADGYAIDLALHSTPKKSVPIVSRWVMEQLRIDAAEVVGRCNDQPAVLRCRHGQGWLYYFATMPTLLPQQNPGLSAWLLDLLTSLGVARWLTHAPALLGNRMHHAQGQYLILTNPTHEPQPCRVVGQRSLQGTVHDVLNHKSLADLKENTSLVCTSRHATRSG